MIDARLYHYASALALVQQKAVTPETAALKPSGQKTVEASSGTITVMAAASAFAFGVVVAVIVQKYLHRLI